MTSEFELAVRFANLPYPAPPVFNPRFGRLDILASWLAATGLSNQEGRTIDRQLVVFCQDQTDTREADFISVQVPEPTGITISRHWLPGVEDNPVERPIESVGQAIELGIEIADRAIDSGIKLLFVASDRAPENHDLEILIGALTRSDAASVASRQSVSDQRWMENVIHIRDEIFALRDRIADPPALLAHTQSMDVAAMLGVICQSANRATPLVIIGDSAHCAALLAVRINHLTREWLVPAVDLTSPVGVLAQRHLDRQPILELGMPFDRDYQTPIAMTAPIVDALLALLAT